MPGEVTVESEFGGQALRLLFVWFGQGFLKSDDVTLRGQIFFEFIVNLRPIFAASNVPAADTQKDKKFGHDDH